jgi:hypothetical protein
MSKRNLIDSIEVKSPCSENWDEMTGSDKARFCSHCTLEVNNLSALTRKQAMRLVRRSNGRICVRYIKNPVDRKPLFADRLYQISRRAGITAGILGASLSLSTISYAQEETQTNKSEISVIRINQSGYFDPIDQEKDKEIKAEGTALSFSGTVTDPNGAVIQNATVTLVNLKTNETLTAATNDEGFYKFENVAAGRYKARATANGFKETVVEMNVYDGEESGIGFSMEVGGEYVTVGGGSVVEYSSALHTAVSNDDVEEVKNLIMSGAIVNKRDENYGNITPLFLAVENGNAEIAENLLNFGAKINAKDDNKQTPLMRLDEDASPELVNLLIRHGAKINLVDNTGNNALILASRTVKTEVLQILINHIANLNAQNSEGRSALMEAADADNLENVRALLEAGANVNLTDKKGETAFDLTTDQEIEKLLESYGAVVKQN